MVVIVDPMCTRFQGGCLCLGVVEQNTKGICRFGWYRWTGGPLMGAECIDKDVVIDDRSTWVGKSSHCCVIEPLLSITGT